MAKKIKRKNLIKKFLAHSKWLKEQEIQASNAYEIIMNKMIDSIMGYLKAEKLVKSDIELPEIPTVSSDVMDSISGVIDKYLQVLKYIMIGQAAGEDIMDIVEELRLKTKIPNGGVIRAYLDAIDTHKDHFEDIDIEPIVGDLFHKKTLEFVKERTGRYIDQSILELKNKVLTQLQNTLNAEKVEHYQDAKSELFDKLESEALNSKEKRELVKETMADAVERRGSMQAVKQALRDTTREYETNWERIVRTEYSMASNTAAAQTIQAIAGKTEEDPIVVIIDKMDDRESEFCKNNSHHDDGGWKYFKLSSLKPAGFNLGQKKANWINSLPPRHVQCRCQMMYILPGYKLNSEGSLVKLEPDEVLTVE